MMRDIQTRIVVRNTVTTPLGQIEHAGFLKDSAGMSSFRVYGHYAVVYVLEGGGTYRDAYGCIQPVQPGDLIFVYPEIAHQYGPAPGRRWTELYIVFAGPVFDFWRTVGLLDPGQPVRHLAPLDSWLERFAAFLEGPPPITAAAKVQEVCRFLALLTEVVAPQALAPAPSDAPDWLAHAVGILETNWETPLTPADVAAQVGMPYETFRKYFVRQMGIGPARYRIDRRLQVARDLLRHTRMTHQQIADSLGFSDEFHFSRQFKQAFGRTPRQYRRGEAEGG